MNCRPKSCQINNPIRLFQSLSEVLTTSSNANKLAQLLVQLLSKQHPVALASQTFEHFFMFSCHIMLHNN